ncbi:MAG TPA: TonB-dependent receptor, partial [Bacteroidales bacterium]|nr:TonB-dependent receptor [Bacteroidales bacterium]
MNKTIFFTLLIALPLFGLSQHTIKGTVTDRLTGEPLPVAHVILNDKLLTTITADDGSFLLKQVKNGDYELIISHIGYSTLRQNIVVQGDITLTLQLEPVAIMEEGVIIRATRATENTPVTYQNIDREAIQRSNTGKDLPMLLANTPSLIVNSDAGAGVGYTSFRIRGTDMTRINITINGIPLNEAESQNVFWVDLPDIAASVDNLQIQRGVGTSTNGAAAFGASVNLLTTRLNNEPYAQTELSGGSFGTARGSLAIGSGLIDKHWAFDARMSGIRSNGYVDRGGSDLQSYYLSGAWYGQKALIKFITFSGRETTYQAWNGVPKELLDRGLRTYNPSGEITDANDKVIGFYDNQTDNYQQDHYQLHFSRELSRNLNLNAAVHYTRGAGYYESYKNNQKLSAYENEPGVIFQADSLVSRTNLIRRKWLDNNFIGTTLTMNYNKKNWDVSGGGAYTVYDGDHFGKIIWAKEVPVIAHDKNWYESNGYKTDLNTFLKAIRLFDNGLSLYGDLQYRTIEYSITGLRDDLTDITQNHTYHFFNPKAGIMYRIDKHHKLYTSYAIANREPSRDNFTDADAGTVPRPEHLQNMEAGYEFTVHHASLGANFYSMKYRDQLVLTGEINNTGDPVMVNVPKSYRIGIELIGNAKLTRFLSWSANLTLSRNKIQQYTHYVDNWSYWDDPENEPYQVTTYYENSEISFS